MTNKILRGTTAERHGPVVVVRYTGGDDCLRLNMYLDCETWQMTCDSDIGSYSYHWYRWGCTWDEEEDFISFCIRWFSNEEWLLRKCIDDKNVLKEFNWDETVPNLRKVYDNIRNNWDEDYGVYCTFDEVLDVANGYDNKDQLIAALSVMADDRGLELPDEWWNCIVEDYTPQQKRFAAICREDIVPKLEELLMENKYD